jgi:putative membrane-bound dehydrogenase-like protein
MKSQFIVAAILASALFACTESRPKLTDEEYAQLSDEQKRSVEFAVDGIEVPDERLELTLFASEPMMTNPTNMDVDDRGRVWIAEAYNYRTKLNPRNPTKTEGDRILIMEDTDGDGVADTSKVFYQGNDINAALGIAVLGDKVYVSVSPYVYVFTDADGDDVPEKKEILFSGVGGEQHDHGMHAVTFAPDGKLYFNYGNAGEGLRDAQGNPIIDPIGRPITNETPTYQEGMVFRMDPDHTNVEILGWNFRNNYEVAVDSYGRMWQSDNDDDGNRGTRINYVMDYGNYGFKDEMTRTDWRTRRINMEDSIPLRHWHLNDPGVVPNLLQTYAGSPTGILVYEGKLLPKEYQNQVIHADAGPNIIRAYPVKESNSGFTAEIINLMDGNTRDNWFRPSDVTVAPDGSIFVSDWYDPGVGGHAMGDLDKGRVYRLAPKGVKYKMEKPDYSSVESLIKLLQNPNRATHFKAFMALKEMGAKAEKALKELYEGEDARMKARAFWLLTKLPNGQEYIAAAAKDENQDIRVAAVRASRINKTNREDFLLPLANDQSPQVRREVALAIRYIEMPAVWEKLAENYQAGDRWYLEALGIAAEGFWDSYLPNYLEKAGTGWTESQEATDLVWRSRSANTATLLGELIQEKKSPANSRYFRALDFQDKEAKNLVLKSLLKTSSPEEQIIALRQLAFDSESPDREILTLASQKAGDIRDDQDFLEIVSKYGLKEQKARLLALVLDSTDEPISQTAAKTYIGLYGAAEMPFYFSNSEEPKAIQAIEKFGTVDNVDMAKSLATVFMDTKRSLAIRETATQAMKGYNSEGYLWEMENKNQIPADMMPIAQKLLMSTWNSEIRAAATAKFGNNAGPEVNVASLLSKSGSIEKGKTIAQGYCLACHKIGNEGIDFGPGLTLIGDKLSEEALYNSILNPSEGMGFGYETQLVKFKDGKEIQCIVNSKTEIDLIVKLVGSSEQTIYKLSAIESVTQLNESLMPKFPLSETELVDLVSYLETLRK